MRNLHTNVCVGVLQPRLADSIKAPRVPLPGSLRSRTHALLNLIQAQGVAMVPHERLERRRHRLPLLQRQPAVGVGLRARAVRVVVITEPPWPARCWVTHLHKRGVCLRKLTPICSDRPRGRGRWSCGRPCCATFSNPACTGAQTLRSPYGLASKGRAHLDVHGAGRSCALHLARDRCRHANAVRRPPRISRVTMSARDTEGPPRVFVDVRHVCRQGLGVGWTRVR